MKKVFPCTVILMVALCRTLSAQSVNGTWQGTLSVPDNPRVALKLANADDGSLRGTLYLIDKLIDKGPLTAALTSVSFTAPHLSVEQVNLDATFRGQLSADGKSIDGTWTQDKHSYPLTLVLATPETLWKHGGPVPLPPMSSTADPAFEVATIKPSPPDATGYSFSLRTRDFAAKNRTVQDLIEFAYQVRDRQISGAPSWMTETRFDIAGKPDADGLPSLDQYRLMIKKLLASRFQLRMHIVQQTFPVYAITRGENAPRLPHSDPEFDAGGIYVKESPDGGQMMAHYVGFSMPMFADNLMGFIQDRQIVDETGMTGHFEFTITISASVLQGGPAGPDDNRADAVRPAIQSSGFKLVPKKEPLDVIVIDHLEKPSAN
jgi:uncharacterized protein (TIGR03435 family)